MDDAAEQSEENTQGIALREAAGPADEAFMCAVYLSTRREEMLNWGWNDAQQEMFARMQFNARRQSYAMQYPEAVDRIIIVDGARAGSLIIERRDEEIRLVDIALLPEHRNRGTGSRIVKELFTEADATAKVIRLHVQRENDAARRLYERLGFSITSENDTHFRMERPPVALKNGGSLNGA